MRYNHITRTLSMLLCAVLLLCSLASCSGPDLTGLSGDELRTYTAMKTENYEVTGSMYAYLFFEIGSAYVSQVSQEELAASEFDDEKKFKDQQYDKDRTWYDYINEYVAEEVQKLLLVCEAATEAGITMTNEDYAYVNDQMTGQRTRAVLYYQVDFDTYLQQRYYGYVNEDDVIKVLLMETLAAKYESHLAGLIEERMTQERIDAHLATMSFENGKDENITRNLGHILSSYMNFDEDQAYENMKTAKKRFEEAGKTDEAFAALWKEFSEDANMIYENLRQGEMIEAIDSWLYAEGRTVGDVGIISTDDGCHLLYYVSEGDPGYIADAKVELEEIISQEILEELRAKFKIKIKKNVINAIDI